MKKIVAFFMTAVMSIGLLSGYASADTYEAVISSGAGTTYYVDDERGDDGNTGNSTETPWKTLDKVNSTVFQPGDTICFRAGGSWEGMLNPKGSGSSDTPIIMDQYGEGDKPLNTGLSDAVYIRRRV